jgi:hypothetical protein
MATRFRNQRSERTSASSIASDFVPVIDTRLTFPHPPTYHSGPMCSRRPSVKNPLPVPPPQFVKKGCNRDGNRATVLD